MSEPRNLAHFPALVIAVAWSIAIAAAVVMAPSQPSIGAAAIALAIPCLALAIAVRPAVLALALVAALLGVGRAELPAADPSAATRATALAGQTATVSGRITDDSRPAAGGSEVLIEPDLIVVGAMPISDIGNLAPAALTTFSSKTLSALKARKVFLMKML